MDRLRAAWGDVPTSTLVALAAYLLTAFLQPPLVDWIKYHGGTGPSSPPMLLPTLANCVGMSLVGCLGFVPFEAGPQPARRIPSASATAGRRSSVPALLTADQRRLVRPVLLCTVIDLLSNAMVMMGLLVVGGGVYVVIYSSCTLWTAVIAVITTDKRLALGQWAGIALLTVGLLANGMENYSTKGSADGSSTGTGILLLIAGTALHSLFFVVTEQTIKGAVPASQLCTLMGIIQLGILLGYNLVICAWYRTDMYLVEHVQATGTSLIVIVGVYAALALNNMVHAAAFFMLLGTMGAVASALLKGVQTVLVFAFSAAVFCQYESTQCATWTKTLSMGFVVMGIVMYGVAVPNAGANGGRAADQRDFAVLMSSVDSISINSGRGAIRD